MRRLTHDLSDYRTRLQLAAVVESSSDAIICKDMDGKITHWNRGAEIIYGHTAEEVIGKSIALLIPSERPDDFSEIMQKLKAGGRVEHYETIRQRKDETRFDVSTSVSPILNIDGKVVGAAAIARDITNRKQAEEVLRKAENLASSGRLAAAVAHELNNPLETLSNLVYLLQHNASLDSAARDYIDIAQKELQRAAHVTRQMLAFHRHSTKPLRFSLSEVLNDVSDLFVSLTRSSGIAVVKRYGDDVTVWAFPAEIRQVLANVLRNAIEATPKGGTVMLHVFASREWNCSGRLGARAVIANNGPGISPENREKIFEPFFTTKSENGTGLGLWVSSGIIQKHGGSIRVRSSTRTSHSGTVFNIFLPYEITQPEDQAPVGVA